MIAAVRGKNGVVRSPPVEVSVAPEIHGVCPGQLAQAEYLARRTKLESMLAQGVLTQVDFDRYDAELVGCLQ